ncbi:MAG TPA: DUF5047 domain-containing protein [Acidimicrobiales bacterium]
MYPRSAAFDDAVRKGGVVRSTVAVAKGGVIVEPDVPWSRPSTITVDETSSSWRSCAITVTDIDHRLLPKQGSDPLSPYGFDLFIKTGFYFPATGLTEQVPVGLFRMVTSRPTRRGQVQIIGFDYSRVVARARFEVPKVYAKGFSRAGAIQNLIEERVPFASFSFSDDGTTVPLTIFEEGERYGSPWKAVLALAEANGDQVLFGPDGPIPTAVLRPIPVASATPVWDYADASVSPGTTKVELLPEMDTANAYNVFVTTGESSDLASDGLGAVRGSAEVTDPNSPMYPGSFGRAPTFLTSSFIRTAAQAQAVSDANLPLKAGGSETTNVVGFAHPAHEAGDTVYGQDAMLGQDGLQVISRFSFDLSLQDVVTYSCRARRVV